MRGEEVPSHASSEIFFSPHRIAGWAGSERCKRGKQRKQYIQVHRFIILCVFSCVYVCVCNAFFVIYHIAQIFDRAISHFFAEYTHKITNILKFGDLGQACSCNKSYLNLLGTVLKLLALPSDLHVLYVYVYISTYMLLVSS